MSRPSSWCGETGGQASGRGSAVTGCTPARRPCYGSGPARRYLTCSPPSACCRNGEPAEATAAPTSAPWPGGSRRRRPKMTRTGCGGRPSGFRPRGTSPASRRGATGKPGGAESWLDAEPLVVTPRLRATGKYERRGGPARVRDRAAEREQLARQIAAERDQAEAARRRLASGHAAQTQRVRPARQVRVHPVPAPAPRGALGRPAGTRRNHRHQDRGRHDGDHAARVAQRHRRNPHHPTACCAAPITRSPSPTSRRLSRRGGYRLRPPGRPP